ncbi:hypothetical protein BDF21DRAFT_496762 [Thamnidium elegans]|uniref:Uncharacterized protein n=1 Tax=Thamnidium elegans TaxID=101142 RepID=A0A8H7SH55_9FUNG|nr:hypothetical protein INT48_008024 [Thamnidium elegans]KAI8064034.1 hypothetical protein BDF21DRAFT_496762 [Thamnidium elegans]
MGINIADTSTSNGVEESIYRLVIDSFDTVDMKWHFTSASLNASLFPLYRKYFTSVMSPGSDALYLLGGSKDDINTPVGIIRYDLINQTSVVDLSIAHPSLNFSWLGGSADMLPNGVVVLAFGAYSDGSLYNSSQVLLFDTNINEIIIQPINGIAPNPRTLASSTLGPDKTTIYYFGGQDDINLKNLFAGSVYNDLVILDTNTWSWISLKVTGVSPMPSISSRMTVFGQNKIFISTGLAFNFISTSVSVLNNVPSLGESIESSNLQWFTNYDVFDNPSNNKGLSGGAIAGIVIGVLLFIVIIFFLLWRYVPATKDIAKYIQQDLIWNPRSIESPIIPQYITEETSEVLMPDIRFCFDGFSDANFLPLVSCAFRNGTDCSDRMKTLDNNKQAPVYLDFFGDVSCTMFYPEQDFRIINDNQGYTDSTGTKVQFSFFAEPLEFGNIDLGVIYIDFYPPGRNPNVKAQGLNNETKISDEDYSRWLAQEKSSNSIQTILLRQGVRSAASYTLTTIKTMRKNDGWNYIGFSSSYDDSMDVKTSYKDAPQNINNMPFSDEYAIKPISQLVVQPDAFVLKTSKDQKVFTLLNAFAQAGGVLGLFIAVQTILFGFRPQSPWGIVHRWSFGSLKIKLTDRLANYFNTKGTPVPLINPVSTRLNNANGYSYFSNSSNTYIPAEPDVPSAVEGIAEQENRMHHMEERLQIMELLLKSYYLNAEVFKSLDDAVKRGHKEKRRSSLGIDKNKDTDSVLQNDALSQEFDSRSDDQNRLFQMQPRGTYQTNLASQAPLEVYDEEHEIERK